MLTSPYDTTLQGDDGIDAFLLASSFVASDRTRHVIGSIIMVNGEILVN